MDNSMNKFCAVAMVCGLGWATGSGAEVFYGGDPKGFAGEEVNLTINARAGTTLEAIDIVPDIDAVSGVLHFVSFTPAAALTDDGSPLCTDRACSVTYDPVAGKTFLADAVLATVRFSIDPAALPGPVPFDAGVVVGEDPLPVPQDKNFAVLAVPEPASGLLFVAGLSAIGFALRRRQAS